MTPEELRDIDHKVLDALGIAIEYWSAEKDPAPEDLRGPMVEREDETFFECRPSADLNAAMYAAEKAGLFDAHEEYCDDIFRLSRGWDGWDAIRFADPYTSGNSHISGPLAICQCILRFKGKA